MSAILKSGKVKILKWAIIILVVLGLFLFAGWKFQWASISFLGFELSPPKNKDSGLTFVPQIVFYDKFGNPIEKEQGALTGGPLKDYSKILFLLSTRLNSDEGVKIKFLSSSIALSDGIETKQIHQSELGQEFVLFSNREITADIANLNPQYLLEARDLNPNKKIDLHIVTKVGIIEPRSNKIVEEKEIYIICKNTSNLVSSNYQNADLATFYPSCLITNIELNKI